MTIKRKRGRPKLSEEEKKARAKARAEMKKIAAKEESDKAAERINNTRSYLLTPAGKCPVPLLSTSEDAVRVWIKNLLTFKTKGQHTVQSISYWIRHFYDYFSKEHKIVEEHVKYIAHEFEIMDYTKRLKQIYKTAGEECKNTKSYL